MNDNGTDRAARPTVAAIQRFHRDRRGQVMVIGALMAMVFVMFWLALFGIGEAVGDRMQLQDASDAMAYTEALWGARTMNWIAYTNRAQVANIIILTQFSIIHSHAKWWFDVVGVLGMIVDIIKFIPFVNAATAVLEPIMKVVATAVAIYEKVARIVADIGIPIFNYLMKGIYWIQYLWIPFLLLFPFKSHQVLNKIDPDLATARGQLGLGNIRDASSASGVMAGVGQLAMTAYAFYQYYQLLTPPGQSIPRQTDLEATSAFNTKVSVWKRLKFVTEETANYGTPKNANQPFIYKWDDRGIIPDVLKPFLNLNLGILKISFDIGGETHVERYSRKDVWNNIWTGNLEMLAVGLWQWHRIPYYNPGYKPKDSYAHDYFEITLVLDLWFKEFTLFSLGIHEVELSSEEYTGEEVDDSDQSPGQKSKDEGQNAINEGNDLIAQGQAKKQQAADLRTEADGHDASAAAALAENPPNQAAATYHQNQASSKRSQADTLDAQGDADIAQGQETVQAGQNMVAQGEQLDDIVGDISSTVQEGLSSLYHDAPVYVFWYYMNPRWTGQQPEKRDAKKRWDGPEDIWEIDSATQTNVTKRENYVWTTDGKRVITHYILLTKAWEFPLEGFGLARFLFRGDQMLIDDGYTVVSRAEVVYVHPSQGRRTEWPNVFNPNWRARLGPMSKDINDLMEKIPGLNATGSGLGGTIASALRSFFAAIFSH